MTPPPLHLQELLDWLAAVDARLPAEWPPELPPEATPGFWFAADPQGPPLSPLSAWLYRRRIEWLQRILDGLIERGILRSPLSLAAFVELTLIELWQAEGCQAFWRHAEGAAEAPGAPRSNPDSP